MTELIFCYELFICVCAIICFRLKLFGNITVIHIKLKNKHTVDLRVNNCTTNRLYTALYYVTLPPSLFLIGKPKPTMSWFFNGEQIKEDEDFKFVEDGDRYSLVIAEVFPDDGGKYVCRITNEVGTAECSVNVEVKGTWS